MDYLIEYIMKYEEELVDEQTKEIKVKTKRELTLELKNLFNQRLIKPEVKDRFDFLYNMYYKCLICNDVVFDPILCIDCEVVFCYSCVSELDNYSNKSSIYLNCKHENIIEIPDINKRKFENIKLNCYYNCSSHSLIC